MKKTIMIVGGSDGMGKAIAQALATSHNVIIASHSYERASVAAMQIGCGAALADVTQPETLATAFVEAEQKYGRLDVVVNCAGAWVEGTLDDNDEIAIRRVIEVNALGTVYSCQAAIRVMKKQKGGLIININSQSGLYYKSERSVYHASKWAVTGFTGSLQQEVAKYGIRVTGFYPAKVDTKFFEKVGITKSKDGALSVDEVAQSIKFIIELANHIHIPEFGIKHIAG